MATTPRQFTPEFKAQVVLELLTQARSAAEICRTHQLKDSLLYRSARICRWKQEFLERAPRALAGSESGEATRQAQRIAELERMVGRLTLELDVQKKPRKGYAATPAASAAGR